MLGENGKKDRIFPFDSSLLDHNLRNAVMLVWDDPTKESAVKELWREVVPDVFQCQLFDPERLADLHGYLDEVLNAQLPLRPPYAIVLDGRSEGYLATPSL
jgi:hypothetical protein